MRQITQDQIHEFEQSLTQAEKAPATVQKYLHAIYRLQAYLDGAELTRERLLDFRACLLEQCSPQTVNGFLAAVRSFLNFLSWDDLQIRSLKVQHRPFRDETRELTKDEYRRLLSTARGAGKERIFLVMETICATGIRVSELSFFTVEAVRTGRIGIRLKGKSRTILMPKELRRTLLAYAGRKGIREGVIFRTRTGQPLNRSNIAHEMKRLCALADVDPRKVFPHNLRHLFARTFYAIGHNLAHLADVLGHSRIETTRIYVAVSASEHEKILEQMHLLC